ncbi:Cytochrome P460 [uncultured Sphingopyxis sp.]|uniref:Cytochrome P460 n=1 Tax=uncultured Sphingopyxis sp. TaxID=310581 RepID=A0A1Y5PQR4_9SPHN|nr:cytochrome P460 family protein [uncultured Sphingopyxis sp.]SBV32301.1 Cytochrome P460 [uncultured Sphingopyxis sp.]
MRKSWISLIMVPTAAIAVLAGCSSSQPESGAQAKAEGREAMAVTPARYLPEYAADGSLELPKNWRTWVFIGAPLTPNALNNGEASFPEFHNVYIEPGSYAIYKKTGEFPEGTIFFKELQLALPGEYPDGSRTEPSGRGYFPAAYNGADVTVKDSRKYAETGGWGYYNFNHHEPKAATAMPRPKDECASCHIASAKKDDVWTQFYPLLDDLSLN